MVSGLVYGFKGVVDKPIEEERNRGAKGILTGLGKGVAGLFAKPVGAVFDGISLSLDSLKRSSQTGFEAISSVRLPRHLINEVVTRHVYLFIYFVLFIYVVVVVVLLIRFLNDIYTICRPYCPIRSIKLKVTRFSAIFTMTTLLSTSPIGLICIPILKNKNRLSWSPTGLIFKTENF